VLRLCPFLFRMILCAVTGKTTVSVIYAICGSSVSLIFGFSKSSGSPAASFGRVRSHDVASGYGSFSRDRPIPKSGW
jgi:hypothetical protein